MKINQRLWTEKYIQHHFKLMLSNIRGSHPAVFCKKKVLLKILQNSLENICARFYFLTKLQT